MFAEVLTGIALFQKSVDFIKSNINTCKDIREISGEIENLFEAQSQINKKRSKKDGMTIADQFGVKSVASEVIDAKLAAERLYEVSVMVDQRFGHGTWAGILAERKKRIDEAKAAEKKRRLEKKKQQEEIMEVAGYFALGICILILIFSVLFAVVSFAQIAQAGTEWKLKI
tara:strand:- start:17491 stop:18003 length:513 start_codon:yes stop_codon:yes gene_type:complete